MRFLAGFVCALALLAIAGAAYIYSGQYDVAASTPHGSLEKWVLSTAMTHSVVSRADNIGEPPTFTDEMVRDGFAHYDDMCATCHVGPGIEQSEISKGLNPPAPNIAEAVKAWTPRQLFWIIKNGVKMTAMPSFGATHNDQQVWNIVAFVEKLPGMSPQEYERLKQTVPGDTHEHLMDDHK